MSTFYSNGLSMSLDGFVAGPHQDQDNPLGVGGARLHEWIFDTKSGRAMIGKSGGSEGVDNDVRERGSDNVGATIMGRNMFGPIRGPWIDETWRGWWGEQPPFHHDVFVLTHFPRPELAIDDTTFHFITGGIVEALSKARDVAGDRDVSLGGGAEAIRQYLDAGLLDELRLAVVPIELGSGERLVTAVGAWPHGYECRSILEGEGATHYELIRS